ncbi:SDR family oxidoreductase [Arenibacter sp. P308M17]|uniref:SDR family oxidoreductase n=1 Tax=Arenibacter sp. P308M17 TaxID=2303391 RepID=UPI001C6DF42E|nr:SDR family oxidoreductase [Arenibacter sp. P308M17]
MKNLNNKVVLVTGASKGLGASIAMCLAKNGAKVAMNYLSDHSRAKKVKSTIEAKGGIVRSYAYDITEVTAVFKMVDEIERDFGPIDVIVNNATGPQPLIKLEDQIWDDYLGQMNFFVKAPLFLLKANLKKMQQRKVGRIINIGSEVVELGNKEFGHYVAAKGAMLALTRSWATELGPFGITCNLVAPGWIPVERHLGTSEEDHNLYTSNLPLGHQGSPNDIGEVVAFLASDSSKFITGQKIAVNGGKTFL